ncbi:hypothetical protein BDU57DRAFT_558891 [Ampelomyces quisqualis]|uniref:Uncharacterized protein n=1 Tax=Ampelomyces quisqualis TaxID=50730 RepID=A0A6A5QF70_AMPQU|nr:hypothetical protein BDU57DRAFT_558891 [Ampelomyces quisqualis]
MSEFKTALKAYDLDVALALDRSDPCLVIDVAHNESGQLVPSLQRVIEQVDKYFHDSHAPTFTATKLYVIGQWNLTTTELQGEALPEVESIKKRTDSVKKWAEATAKICNLLEQMGNLEELTWISGLPFTSVVFEKLPTTLKKLVIDVGEPVRLEQDGDVLHKSFITQNELKPLKEQVKLKELRLFRVRDSVQSIVWETVFRNTSEGSMRVLDVQMAAAPIVRSERWKKAKDVAGLTVPTESANSMEYKGKDGKGVLHYSIGTGEYLDDFCIRKARIASGLDEATPLPLWCLKLDGFVIDYLPFQHELSSIVLLACGDNCIDSGLRAPKTSRAPHNKWSRAVNNAVSHCLIQWPNWTGIFDDHGDQRSRLGAVVSQEMALSTPAAEFSPSPIAPLTKETLDMKAMDEALTDPMQSDYFLGSPILKSSAAQTPLGATSNKSERGSDVPTPTLGSLTAYSPISVSTDTNVVVVDGANDALSPTSTLGSFEHITPSKSIDEALDMATNGPDAPATDKNSTPKTSSTFAHKVRRSYDWLTRSST